MNLEEAKTLLLLYRPGTADDTDPDLAEALALARTSPELGRWLDAHRGRQEALRAKLRQIAPPPGLKEQIISEHAASRRRSPRLTLPLALAGMFLLLGSLAVFMFPRHDSPPENTLANYQSRMVRIALSPYAMDCVTNSAASIRAYLARNAAPADFVLPAPLEQAVVTGCAVREWQGAKVSLVCFRTGKPLPPNTTSDLWLFVADQTSVAEAGASSVPHVARVNRLITATWTSGGKLYFLGVQGEEPDLRRYL